MVMEVIKESYTEIFDSTTLNGNRVPDFTRPYLAKMTVWDTNSGLVIVVQNGEQSFFMTRDWLREEGPWPVKQTKYDNGSLYILSPTGYSFNSMVRQIGHLESKVPFTVYRLMGENQGRYYLITGCPEKEGYYRYTGYKAVWSDLVYNEVKNSSGVIHGKNVTSGEWEELQVISGLGLMKAENRVIFI